MHLLLLVTASEKTAGNHVQEVLKDASVAVLGALQGAFELFDLVLCQFVRDLASNRVQEVDASESSSDNGVDLVTGTLKPDLGAASDVGEDITLAHLDESQLGVVAVSEEVYAGGLANEPKGHHRRRP